MFFPCFLPVIFFRIKPSNPPISQENRSFLLGVPSLFLSKTSLFCGNKKRNSAEREAHSQASSIPEVRPLRLPALPDEALGASGAPAYDAAKLVGHMGARDVFRTVLAAVPQDKSLYRLKRVFCSGLKST